MPLSFGANIVEGKVYRSKKKQDDDDEKQALKELQTVLSKKNRKACDCEAQIHDLIENCLVCGRLTCSAEGPGKCISCGNIILDQNQRNKLSKYIDIVHPKPSLVNKPSSSALNQSRIIDNQYDHFAIDNKKHLKESDKQMLKATLEELQAKRYQRKLVFEVDIDNLEAGTRPAPLVDDYEAELRFLQLNENIGPKESNLSLSELVQLESKKTYNLEYIEAPNEDHNKSKKQQTKRKETQSDCKDGESTSLNKNSLQTTSSKAITNQNKPNKTYEYKTNHKSNKNNRNFNFNKKKDVPKPSAWNKNKK